MKRMMLATMVALATLGSCLPQCALAAAPPSRTPPVLDVTLGDGGILLGQVVSAQGVAQAKTPVTLVTNGKQLAAGTTDARGYFAFSGVTSGVYQVASTQGAGLIRTWSRASAPPAAQPGVMLVNDQHVARGANGNMGGFILSTAIATGIAAGIAIPVAVIVAEDAAEDAVDDLPASP